MTLMLPPLLAALVAAHNAHDGAAFLACFADDAVVRDDGHTHFGKAAIRAWFDEVSRTYAPNLDVNDLTLVDGEPVLTGTVSGNFPGSPAPVRYLLGLEDEKIVALKIVLS